LKEQLHSWLQKLRKSDINAYEMIFHHFYGNLCRYAFSILNDRDEAEEFVQETLLILWTKRKELEKDTNLNAYLFRLVYNKCLNHKKHLKVRFDHQMAIIEKMEKHEADPHELMISAQLEKQINDAIEALPEKCAEVFKLNRFQGLKYREIAEKTGLSEKTIEAHISRALKVLRKVCAEYLPLLAGVTTILI